MAWYEYPGNFSGGQNVSGIGSLLQYANGLTNVQNSPDGGIMGFVLMWTIWAISFFTIKGASSSTKAFASASFMTFFLSIFLMRIDLLGYQWVALMGLMMVLGLLGVRGEARLGL